MDILCRKCGQKLAKRKGKIITVNNSPVPTENIDGVIFKCEKCKRIRTYYFGEEAGEVIIKK